MQPVNRTSFFPSSHECKRIAPAVASIAMGALSAFAYAFHLLDIKSPNILDLTLLYIIIISPSASIRYGTRSSELSFVPLLLCMAAWGIVGYIKKEELFLEFLPCLSAYVTFVAYQIFFDQPPVNTWMRKGYLTEEDLNDFSAETIRRLSCLMLLYNKGINAPRMERALVFGMTDGLTDSEKKNYPLLNMEAIRNSITLIENFNNLDEED
jgi:hypothetical protein